MRVRVRALDETSSGLFFFSFYSFTEGRSGTDGNNYSGRFATKEKAGKAKMDADDDMRMYADAQEMKMTPKHSQGNFRSVE